MKIRIALCIAISLFFCVGCFTTESIVVNQDRVVTAIDNKGIFVTKGEFIKLLDGEEIKAKNPCKGLYYIPPNHLVHSQNGKVHLKMEDGK